MKKKGRVCIKTTRTGDDHCPRCKSHIDCQTSSPLHLMHGAELDEVDVAGAVPKPGAMSVCLYCAVILTVDADMKLRVMEPHELATVRGQSLPHYLGLMEMVDVVKRMMMDKGTPEWAMKFL